ncbi:MAG TPA: NADH-quinone oxidoreductase subunit N, partial [Anaerolineales bacterium]|nr:NADH-quinone oxidoreductase subunit N [Anaerolineales bacterium]
LQAGSQSVAFNGMAVVDGFTHFMNILLLGSGLVGVALAYDYLQRNDINRGEYYILLMFAISGMMLMATAADLIVVFIALELLSIPLYVLSGFAAPRSDSEEAALKYFLLGAFSSGFVVYGVALVFGATGSTALVEIAAAINAGTTNLTLLAVGAGLILIGLGFKVAAVPFHMWTPDVYQGAPSPVTAFMAVGAKTAGFAALLRVFVIAFPSLAADLTPILWGLAALTMILGNVAAIAQTNIKRLLAYSSISHAGYILMAIVPFGQPAMAVNAVASALFYLVAYAFTNFTAWAVVISLENEEGKGLNLSDYAGLGRKHPALAAAMTVSMLSFTGVPPTLGFLGKFFLFRTVIEGGYIGLALIGVLTSLISAYYYLRVGVVLYMQDGEPEVVHSPWVFATAIGAAALTVILTIFATPLFQWASQAILRIS